MQAETKTKISTGISLTDEAFHPKLSKSYHLAMQAGADGMYYTVLDPAINKYVLLETFTFQGIHDTHDIAQSIENVIAQKENLRLLYKGVSFAMINNRSTLVPNPLFDNEKKAKYLGFNHALEKDEEVLVDMMKNIEAKNIFALSGEIKNAIKKHHSYASFHHFSTPLIDGLVSQYKNQNGKKVVVHIQASHFEIVVLEGKSLVFYNTFNYASGEDFIYYLLFVCEQLKLNPEQMELILTGEITRESSIYNLLFKYVRNVKFGDRPEAFQYSAKTDLFQKHFYRNIFSQYLCV